MRIEFTVPGEPMGAPRMTRSDKWKQRDCVMRYRAWKDAARAAAGKLPEPNSIIALNWTAYFEPPASWSAKKRAAAMGTIHRVKPDRDNLDKSVLDALFVNDAGIAVGTIAKRYGTPARMEVVIEAMDALPLAANELPHTKPLGAVSNDEARALLRTLTH